MLIAIALVVVIVLLAAWELWICEGTHLGRRFVVWMYDVAAGRYEGIKRFDPDWERRFLGEPLAAVLGGLPDARVLDVGAGTGRTARSLLAARGGRPPWTLVNLEPSHRMLGIGRRLVGQGVNWVRGWAVPLPFSNGSFDLVVSLEMLEFTPDPLQTLAEMRRVLRRGGILLITNRIGWEAPLMFGKTVKRDLFARLLAQAGFQPSDVLPWQMDYDLAWAHKPWN
jgi:ubiquinone/menaquinone biosynthesis C-methylase UbiE